MQAPVLDAFPRRPIALAKTNKNNSSRKYWLIAAALLLGLGVYWAWGAWQAAGLRADLQARGVNVSGEVMDGSCTTRRGQTLGCRYHVRYRPRTEEGGGEREGDVYVPGMSIVVMGGISVRYDPQDPSRVMSSREVEEPPAIWNVLIPIVLPIVIGGFALLVGAMMGSGKLAAAVAAPRPALIPVLDDVLTNDFNKRRLVFRRADGREGQQFFPNVGPCYVAVPGAPPDQVFALGLLGPGDVPIILSEDLSELELTDEERSAVLAATRG